ncbi:hypothetical protein ACIQRS_30560 [Streptomyces termitum]|uniref:Uncharacterized protein n=1 Tax=Streptomyces termitum TaxID=67368 RepID=A0A918T1F8_9ACTN|nr:hypothetical protein [Streptomyces termitum]GHA84345.1 hypothetical protein GCM10010305_30100 [Streptomyces termitum]
MTEPTRHTTYNGPVVQQTGDGNIGFNHGTVHITKNQEVQAAAQELLARLAELGDRAVLTREQSGIVEAALPVLARDPGGMAEGGLTLARLGLLASAVGPVAQPVADALARLLGLLAG